MNSHFYAMRKLILQQILQGNGMFPVLIKGFGTAKHVMCRGTALAGMQQTTSNFRKALHSSLDQRIPDAITEITLP